MATPENLTVKFPDYCRTCRKGDYEIITFEFIDHTDYGIKCTHQYACRRWAALMSSTKEVTDET